VTETQRTKSPADYELVTADSITAILRDEGLSFVRVHPVRPGAVRIEIRGVIAGDRRRQQKAIISALGLKRSRNGWHLGQMRRLPPVRHVVYTSPRGSTLSILSGARPFTSWVTVRDCGEDWHDGQGRSWYEHITDPCHPNRCSPDHLHTTHDEDVPDGDR
jgi:hypothetical protein